MLIAPIFHSNYLTTTTKQTEIQNNASSSTTNSSQNKTDIDSSSSATTPASRYNIFKTALNKGTELIRSTFLSKSTNYSDSVDSSASSSSSFSTSASTTTTSTKPSLAIGSDDKKYEMECESKDDDERCSSDDSYCSSPDSIRTELMFFKPITREAQTFSSSTKIIRVPSIVSRSSTSTTIQSPCPTPDFFIPITPQRHSAFSFVGQLNNNNDIVKPKSTKRRNTKISRQEELNQSQMMKAKRQRIGKNESEEKTDAATRQTRSMKKTKSQEVLVPTSKKKEFKSPLKVARTKKHPIAVDHTATASTDRRVTRSMKN